jgi:hypothetical protein
MKIEREEKKKIFESHLNELVKDIEINLNEDPISDFGISKGAHIIELIDSLKGNELDAIRMTIWEKGFNAIKNNPMSPEVVAWVEKATDAYWRKHIESIINKQ